MSPLRRRLPALALAALLAGACGSAPGPTTAPSDAAGATAVPVNPSVTERPFARVDWPAGGSACGRSGSGTRLGRVEAVDELTVRFTLCQPDGAFLARIAHPSLGVVDAAAIEAAAASPAALRAIAGAGQYRVASWVPGQNVRLTRVAAQPGSGDAVPTVILRWDGSSSARSSALQAAEVDGIDTPDATDLAIIGTLPEMIAYDREGLATAYLGFGGGPTFASVAVRRAIAQGIDRAALAADAFPPGSAAASHVAPCSVPGGCAGKDWYTFNGPAGTAALQAARFDLKKTYPLYIPDEPVPGLPDPAAVGEAVRAQLADSLGMRVAVTPMPAADLSAAIAAGKVGGLYLGGVASPLADASGYLEPLFGTGVTGTAAGRAKGVLAALKRAAASTDQGARAAFFAAANNAIRSTAPLVPLVHAGSTMAFRGDVRGVTASPLGIEALGSFMPADRHQVVVMQDAEPTGSWCGAASAMSDLRLCALVTPGLYAFAPGTLNPVPALASRCTPSEGATVWTCRLRAGLHYSDGAKVDAGDVVASMRAQGDASSPLRAAFPSTAFAAWDALFGGPLGVAGTGG